MFKRKDHGFNNKVLGGDEEGRRWRPKKNGLIREERCKGSGYGGWWCEMKRG